MAGGTFAVSLDFELYWGMRDRVALDNACKTRLEGVYSAVPALLQCFQQTNIHATWAIVGFIFFENTADLRYYLPQVLPQYHDRRLNPFLYLPNTDRNPSLIPYYYAPQLIELIKQNPHQEIASHSLSNYYSANKGADLDSFMADLIAAKKIANRFEVTFKSYVFPRQQHLTHYIEQLPQQGIQSFRGSPNSFIHHLPEKRDVLYPLKRGLRLVDSIYNISGHHTFTPSIARDWEYPIINIPASRFFNPYCSSKTLNDWRLKRIKQSMTYAAQHDEVFHLWWHIHHFGTHLSENMQRLEQIIEHFLTLQTKYGMSSRNMQEIAKTYPVPCVHNTCSHHLAGMNPASF